MSDAEDGCGCAGCLALLILLALLAGGLGWAVKFAVRAWQF